MLAPSPATLEWEAFDDFAFSGNREHRAFGESLIRQGEVGCLLLAGGQGTRLNHKGPKGTYPISSVKNKSLFQLCAEKVKAASTWANRPLKLALMTSPENDDETRAFFQLHQFFGLEPSQISFFTQSTLPFLNEQAHLFLKNPWTIAEGPDGNGHCLIHFYRSGILADWLQAGVKWINLILIDNPLALPFDAELVGFHAQQKAEITLKCTEKKQPEEKVGVLVKENGHCKVVEYSEMADKEKKLQRPDGKLKHCCANLSLFCISMSFIQQIIENKIEIPLHMSWKTVQEVEKKFEQAWKFETYIFDWLPYAKKVSALLYPREECFAPLKNHSGPDSPETVRLALQERDKQLYSQATGLPPPSTPFELDPEFYLKSL